VSEVLKVEEQQVIPKVQERQTLRGEKTDGESQRAVRLDQIRGKLFLSLVPIEISYFDIEHLYSLETQN